MVLLETVINSARCSCTSNGAFPTALLNLVLAKMGIHKDEEVEGRSRGVLISIRTLLMLLTKVVLLKSTPVVL